jgi:hypothetical protein
MTNDPTKGRNGSPNRASGPGTSPACEVSGEVPYADLRFALVKHLRDSHRHNRDGNHRGSRRSLSDALSVCQELDLGCRISDTDLARWAQDGRIDPIAPVATHRRGRPTQDK